MHTDSLDLDLMTLRGASKTKLILRERYTIFFGKLFPVTPQYFDHWSEKCKSRSNVASTDMVQKSERFQSRILLALSL